MTSKEISRFIGKRIWLRKLGYFFISLTTLREWYIHRALKQIVDASDKPMAALDAGFGMGQHSYYLARRLPNARLTAIEQDKELVTDFEYFLQQQRLNQVSVLTGDIQTVPVQGPLDLILCCSVMEHIPDDVGLMQRFYALLAEGGRLLIYVPTSERRVLKHLENKIHAMTSATGDVLPHGHVRYDQSDEMSHKLEKCGFTIETCEISYGPYGRLAYDLVTTVQFSRYFKILFPFYLIFLHPLVLLLMMFDFYRHNDEGNGLLILSSKPLTKS